MNEEQKSLASSFLGLDVAKEEIEICVLDAQGIIIDTFNTANNHKGFYQIIKRLPNGEEPAFAIESTGSYSGNLTHFLRKTKCQVVLTNPFHVSRLRDAFSKSVKNDVIDAFVLAQALRMNILKDSQKNEEFMFLQDILERYYDLVDRKTALTNQLRATLIQTFPAIDKIFSDITCNAALAILSNFQTGQDLLNVVEKDLVSIIKEGRGRFSVDRIVELQEECKISIGWKTSKWHRNIIVSQIEELKLLKFQIKEMKSLLKEYTEELLENETKLLMSVPGVGTITSYYLLAVIGDHTRFDRNGDGQGASRLSSYVGYGVFEYSSGPRSTKRGISKRGNSRLRGLLFMAASAASRSNEEFKKRYELLKERKGNGRHALTAIGHSILRRCYGVLKSGRKYDQVFPKVVLKELQVVWQHSSHPIISDKDEGLRRR